MDALSKGKQGDLSDPAVHVVQYCDKILCIKDTVRNMDTALNNVKNTG